MPRLGDLFKRRPRPDKDGIVPIPPADADKLLKDYERDFETALKLGVKVLEDVEVKAGVDVKSELMKLCGDPSTMAIDITKLFKMQYALYSYRQNKQTWKHFSSQVDNLQLLACGVYQAKAIGEMVKAMAEAGIDRALILRATQMAVERTREGKTVGDVLTEGKSAVEKWKEVPE